MCAYICVLLFEYVRSFFCLLTSGTAKINAGKHRKLHLLDRKYKDQESEASIKDLFASVWVK